jgi:hypothetical protein
MEEDRKHPSEWEKEAGIKVADADGWMNAGVPWSRPITKREFNLLCAGSTVNLDPS